MSKDDVTSHSFEALSGEAAALRARIDRFRAALGR